MSIYHNGKEYGATKVINYSAAPDYNRGVTVDNIQTGNYQATDNGFLMIQLQSQQSNPTKVSVVRSKTPITDTGTEIASIVLSQYQYSETLTAQVMARDYYKLVIEGVGNPQVISCMFYPYASTVPIKLTEDISIEQVEGLESELDGKQDKGNYFNKDSDKINLAKQVTGTLASANIADNAITSAKIANKTIVAGDIADNTITSSELADNAVDTAAIASGAVTGAKIASKTIKGSNIVDNTITSTQIAANAITSSELASNSVTNAKISDGAVTDAKFSGRLSFQKGGTGTNNGLNWKNAYTNEQMQALLGKSGSDTVTTNELVMGLIKKATPLFCMAYLYKSFFTDLPLNPMRCIINLRDTNQTIITAYAPFTFETWECAFNQSVVTWKKIRNADGSIPAELISPTVLKYENSDGVWTETKLTTGEIMLEGSGTVTIPDGDTVKKIILPKSLKQVLTATVNGITLVSPNTATILLHHTVVVVYGGSNKQYYWSIKGILAQ